MIQQRQFRKEHEDSHYAAAIFRYEREYSIKVCNHCNFVCVDDKHRAKVERVMSTLNPGMQCVGLMRGRGSEEFEEEVRKCNSLANLRSAAEKHSNFKEESLDSMAPVKVVLSDLFR